MTSQGTAHGRFQRALDRGNLDQAEMAAREMGRLSLIDALSLVVGYAKAGSPKFEPAAVRWEDEPPIGTEVLFGDGLVEVHVGRGVWQTVAVSAS